MAAQPDFELYGFWRTSATYRVRVALNLKGLSAREHVVDLDAGDQLSESFLKINPLGGIPALVEPGQLPLTQSLAILEFLDETHPTPPLLPGDPHGRARVRSIAAMLAGDTHPLITPRVRKYLVETGGFDQAGVRAWMTHWFGSSRKASCERAGHRNILPRRSGHDRRHLPRQHYRADAGQQAHSASDADHRSHHGALRGDGRLCQGASAEAGWCTEGLSAVGAVNHKTKMLGARPGIL